MSEVILQAKGLTKHYGTTIALDHLTLDLHAGEVLGYLGPNGAGKTTTIRAMLGLIKPTGGTAEIFGFDAQRQKLEAHKKIAYVPGEATLWPSLTGEETLHLLGNVHGAIDTGYRDELISRFKFDPAKKVRAYSKGNRQKLNLIAALMTRAPLLIMDEPTNGLDPLMEQVFRDCIREAKSAGQAVFLSSHILDEVEVLCDRVAILRAGKLIEIGTLKEMRHLSSLKVEIIFDGPAPALANTPNVQNIQQTNDHHIQCEVNGSIAPLLQTLANTKVIKLLSREPSLEELFLTLYGAGEV
jgi:ABC-2 type transport system ATP-binding protein